MKGKGGKDFPSGAGVGVGMLRGLWFYGFMVLWFWVVGFMVLWFCGLVVL